MMVDLTTTLKSKLRKIQINSLTKDKAYDEPSQKSGF